MNDTRGQPAVCGHRGARGHWPENTLAGFAGAAGMGVDSVEFDVGMTRDGVVVVFHDATLSRDIVRDESGRWLRADGPPLMSVDFAELRRYDVGGLRPRSGYARRFPGQREVPGAPIPTLDEVLDLLDARGIHANVEIKSIPAAEPCTPPPEQMAEAVYAVLDARGAVDSVRLSSFDWRVLGAMRALSPSMHLSCLTIESDTESTIAREGAGNVDWTAGLRAEDFGGSVPRMVQALGAQSWSPWHPNLDADTVAAARALGLGLFCWTANTNDDLARMLDLRLDGIITDYPDRLHKMLRQRAGPSSQGT